MALAAAAATAAAQDTASKPADPAVATSSIILAPAPAAPAQARSPAAPRAGVPVSPGIHADITSGMPAYNRGPSIPEAPAPDVDLRDVEKPRNQIPRLPVEMMQKYTVHEARPPEFRAVDLYTKAALTDLSFKEHPGLRLGNIFNLNAKAAYGAIRDELRSANRQGLVDTTLAMAVGGDTEEARLMQQAIIDEDFLTAGKDGPVGFK